jgi:hypothetical protein
MSAGQYADVPTHSGVLTSLQIHYGVPYINDLLPAGRTRSFHSMKDEIRRRASLPDIIATNHGVNDALAPTQRRQQQPGDVPIKAGVEGHANSSGFQPTENLLRAVNGLNAVNLVLVR